MYLAVGLGCLLLALIGFELWHSYRLATDLRLAARELQAITDGGLSELDPTDVAGLVHRARLDAQALQRRTRIVAPLTNRLGWLPWFGPTVGATAPMVDYVADLTTAGDELLTGLAPMLDPQVENRGSLSTWAFTALEEARPHLDIAHDALRRASNSRSSFDSQQLPASLREPIERVDVVLPLMEQSIQVLQVLPELLGGEGVRAYLLLAQNDDELRATGGFISGVGMVEIDHGKLLSLTMDDSYAVDDLTKTYPPPPDPLKRFMLADQWMVRDANWSPDYPTSAREIQELYRYSTGTQVDGVIAFDQTAVQQILVVSGPVRVPDTPVPVSADNVVTFMRQARSPSPGETISQEWWEHRKDFMRELGAALVDKVQGSADRQLLLSLARTATQLIREKHLLILFNDPTTEQALANLGWDGALRVGAGDALLVVDSNLGFNKVDPLVNRRISYIVDLRDLASPMGKARISYTNTVTRRVPCDHAADYGTGTYADLQERCYWDYTRVYVPAGTTLLDGGLPQVRGEWLLSGEGQTGDWSISRGEAGTTVFGGLFVLPTRSRADLDLVYQLPAKVVEITDDGTLVYRLRLIKQAGTRGTHIQVSLWPPRGYIWTGPGAWKEDRDGSLSWSGNLVKDVDLVLEMVPGMPGGG